MKKKFVLLLTTLFLGIGLTSCKPTPSSEPPGSSNSEPPVTYTLSVSDFNVEKGSEHPIRYQLNPNVSGAKLVYEIINETVDNMIAITNGVLYTFEEGVANVKARAFNAEGASVVFNVEATFKVTVVPVPDPYGDEIVKNGGFENGYDRWEISPKDPSYVYKITVNNAKSHTEDASLNLWYNPDEKAEKSVELDLLVAQSGLEVSAGIYLFSFWYTGEIGEITAEVHVGEELEPLVSEKFPGYGYKPLVAHNGYVNYGVEVELAEASTISVSLHFAGEPGCWGYLDDVSFELGMLEDLIVAPKDGEDGEHNFISNGTFAYNANGWEITKPEGVSFERVSQDGGRLSAWNVKNEDVISAYYLVKDLPALSYNAAVYFNGGDGAFTSSKLVILNSEKEVLHSQEFTAIGWNNGVYLKATIMDVELSGDVYVGVEVVGSSAAKWINFDNVALWSFGYEPEEPGEEPGKEPGEEPGEGEENNGINVSLASADWSHDAVSEVALANLWFTDGISYSSTKVEGPLDVLTLTSSLSELAEGTYTISVTYSLKHGNLSVNGVTTTYLADNWTEQADQVLLVSDVVVGSDGLLDLIVVMTPGTWSYVKITAINLALSE